MQVYFVVKDSRSTPPGFRVEGLSPSIINDSSGHGTAYVNEIGQGQYQVVIPDMYNAGTAFYIDADPNGDYSAGLSDIDRYIDVFADCGTFFNALLAGQALAGLTAPGTDGGLARLSDLLPPETFLTEDEIKADFTEAAAGITVQGGGTTFAVALATGTSADYHTFDDTNTDAGSILNTGQIIKVYAGENRNGLGWNLPGVRLGTINTAAVVIAPYSAGSGQATPDLSACTVNMVQDGGTLLVRLDWPSPLTDAELPAGKWLVSVSYTIDGETDNTSRLMIVRL